MEHACWPTVMTPPCDYGSCLATMTTTAERRMCVVMQPFLPKRYHVFSFVWLFLFLSLELVGLFLGAHRTFSSPEKVNYPLSLRQPPDMRQSCVYPGVLRDCVNIVRISRGYSVYLTVPSHKSYYTMCAFFADYDDTIQRLLCLASDTLVDYGAVCEYCTYK